MKKTRNRILKVTEELLLSKGYNGFSYNDIANLIGIRKASIHYYYPSKAELAVDFLIKYQRLYKFWCRIKTPLTNVQKIKAYGDMYKILSASGAKICPFAILAAEYPTLPLTVQTEIKKLIQNVEDWLFAVLKAGQESGEFISEMDAKLMSKTIYCSFSNAISMYRIFHNINEFDRLVEQLLGLIKTNNTKQHREELS